YSFRSRLFSRSVPSLFLFLFHDTAPTELYTLSLHDALPIFHDLTRRSTQPQRWFRHIFYLSIHDLTRRSTVPHVKSILIWNLSIDRKSTRLNSSHVSISYAVFCLKKKTQI